MAYLFSDGFDGHGALADRWDVVDASASIVTDGGKYGVGTNALNFAGTSDFNSTTLALSTPTNTRGGINNPIHVSFFVKIPSVPGSDTLLFFMGSSGDGAYGFNLQISASLGLIIFNKYDLSAASSASMFTSTVSICDDEWHHIEIKLVTDNVSGIANLYIDGILDGSFSGDTINSVAIISSPGLDNIRIDAPLVANTKFDDILIWDEEGSSMNTSGQLGVHRIETLIPNGAGNSTQLTVTGAASNYLAVDEVGADDDTTYVQSSTTTHKDLYTYTNMAGVPATINGVVVHTRGTNPDNGAISFKTKTRQNAVEADGTTYQLPASGVYAQHADFIAQNPDGPVAWTKTTVDAAEFGVEVV